MAVQVVSQKKEKLKKKENIRGKQINQFWRDLSMPTEVRKSVAEPKDSSAQLLILYIF